MLAEEGNKEGGYLETEGESEERDLASSLARSGEVSEGGPNLMQNTTQHKTQHNTPQHN